MNFDYKKLKGLVHYIYYKADKSDLGATKLNKILWFSDVASYMQSGEPITGETYLKESYGPVPAHVLKALDDLSQEGKIFIRNAAYFGFRKKEYVTLARPDLSSFTADEISLVDDFIQFVCCGHTARSISELTHNQAWELAQFGEEIPYYSILVGRDLAITQDDMEWARISIAEDCGA